MKANTVARPRAALSGKLVRLLCAAVLACGLVPALSVEQAFAAEPKFIGSVRYLPSFDEKGYPEYNEDGSIRYDEAYVALYDIENASGTVQIPATFDVTVVDDAGNESVVKDVAPYQLYLNQVYRDGSRYGWSNPDLTGIDLTQCASISRLGVRDLEYVKSVDLGGLSRLSYLGIGPCSALERLNVEGCTSLASLNIGDDKTLSLVDFSQSPWSNLSSLLISDCKSLSSFDGSVLPNLTSLSIGSTGVTSVDVSACSKLSSLDLSDNYNLTSLDVDSIPQGVSQFDCRRCSIENTATLIDRFGEEAVLPQDGGSSGQSGVHVIEGHLPKGFLTPGDTFNAYLGYGGFSPTNGEMLDWSHEDVSARESVDNWSIVSSDPSIVEAEITQGPGLTVKAYAAGTAVLTVKYSFAGRYRTYEAEQVVEFAVAEGENPVTAISCEESFDVPVMVGCKVCGRDHQGNASLPVTLTLQDATRGSTYGTRIDVVSSDPSIVMGRYSGGEDGSRIDMIGCKSGKATLTITATTPVGDAVVTSGPTTVQVNVVDAGSPKLKVKDSYDMSYYEGESGGGSLSIVSPYERSLASYEDDAALSLLKASGCASSVKYGNATTMVDGRTITLLEAASDKDAVASASIDERGTLLLDINGAGAAQVTIKDIWGNEGTCRVRAVSRTEEAKKLSLSQSEITIKKGETFDLTTLVEGIDTLDPAVGFDELLVFKTGNGHIAPVAWSGEGALGCAQVSSILGRNIGDVTVSATMRVGNGGGSLFDLDEWEVVEFGKLTVHVVDDAAPNPATAVEVTGDSSEVEMGSTLQLSAVITPANADNAKDLAWSSSDEGVAKVDASGKVTPVALGTAAITATVGSVSGTYEVTVVPRVVPATKVSIAGAASALKVGETCQLSATVEPADSTDKAAWSSSDEAVLKVDQSGLVTAVGNGSAVVTATAGSVSAETGAIQVTTPVSGVSLDASSLQLYAGADASKLTATVSPATASNQAIAWSSSDDKVATVDQDGNVAPVAPGTATITATTADGGFAASCTVTVDQHATGIKLDKHVAAIVGAGTVELKATVEPDNATNRGVVWSSSDEGVATVDANGIVASAGKGEAVITAKTEDGGMVDTCKIIVVNPANAIEFESVSANLIKGQELSIAPVLKGSLPGAVSDPTFVSWESSNSEVASVAGDIKSATIAALKTGDSTISLRIATSGEIDLGDGSKQGYVSTASQICTVTVTNPVQSVTLSETSKTVTVGEVDSFRLSAVVDPADGDGANEVSWSSSNEAVATVAADGTVSIKKAGAASITATSGGKSASCALTVNPAIVQAESGDAGFTVSVEVSDPQLAKELQKAQGGDGLNLAVQAVDQLVGPAKDAVSTLTAAGSTIAETFDVHFEKGNGEEIVLNGKDGKTLITVKVKMTAAMKALAPESLKVHFIGDDGTVEDKDTWVDGEYLCFTTEHFSTYAVTGKPPASGGGEASDSGKTDSKPSDSCADTLAATGDGTAFAAAGAMGLAALCALCLAVARRRMS